MKIVLNKLTEKTFPIDDVFFESFTILDCYMSCRVADAGKRKIIPHKPTLDA